MHPDWHKQAMTDTVTGLYNRAYFYAVAETLLAQATRYKHSLSAMLLDIHHFKEVNDLYGGINTGDQVLQWLGAHLRQTVRAADLSARIGGDEFAILMPATSSAQAVHLANRIRATLAEKTFVFEQHRFQVAYTIGIAGAFEQELPSIDTLLGLADHALYQAKAAGGNRVFIYQPGESQR